MQSKITITISDDEAKKHLREVEQIYPNLVGRIITSRLKKYGSKDLLDWGIDYKNDQKIREKESQKRSYQKNKQSIKDKTTLKRIELTHGKTFIIDNIGT